LTDEQKRWGNIGITLSIRLSIHSSVCPSVCPSVHPSVCPSFCPSVLLSVRPVRPSFCPSCPSVLLSVPGAYSTHATPSGRGLNKYKKYNKPLRSSCAYKVHGRMNRRTDGRKDGQGNSYISSPLGWRNLVLLSVRPSVRPSIHPSVRPSVLLTLP
jgi:hypothetical protein